MKKLISCLMLFVLLGGLSALAADAQTAPTLWPAYDPETGLWGYITEDGAWGIKPQYTEAYHFHDGCAIVDMAEHAHADTPTQGIINENGEFLLDPEYYVFDFCEDDIGDIYFVMGFEDEEAAMGWFNIPNRFFSGLHWTECIAYVDSPFVNVDVDTEDGQRRGLALRENGEYYIEPLYDISHLRDYGWEDGYVTAYDWEREEVLLLDSSGQPIALPKGINIEWAYEVREGLVVCTGEETELEGYLNTAGEIVIEPQFSYAGEFIDGYAEVILEPGDESGAVIDRQGKVVLTGTDSEGGAGYLEGYFGMVAGALWVDWADDTWGLVETDGTIRCQHTRPEGMYDEWLLEVAPDGPIWVKYSMGDEEYAYGLMSRDGAILVEPQWELPWGMMSADPQGWQAAGLDGKWGYLDAYGNTVLPFVCEMADHFQGALARVMLDASTEGYINRAGEVVYQWPALEEE